MRGHRRGGRIRRLFDTPLLAAGYFIIALVTGFTALGLITVQTPAWAGEPSVLKTNQPLKTDLAKLAGESRWLELMAAASDAAQKNASDPMPVAYQLQAMRMLGEPDAALKQADEAVKRFPDNAHIILERAWIQSFKGSWPQALADARRAAEIDPKLVEAMSVQGIAYREMRDWDNAAIVYTKALTLRPDDAVSLLNRGRAYVEKGMWQEARTDLDKSIALNKKSAEAFYHRGRAHAGSGKLTDAAEDLTRAIKLKPEATAPYIVRAEVLARGGKWDASARDAYTAIALGSREARPYLTACQASVALGDFDALAEYADGGIRIAPGNLDFHRFAGRAYREKGELANALAAYDKAVNIAPQDAALLLERALTNIMLRRYEQAVDDCTASLAAKTSSTAYALRGFARLKAGSLDRALEDSTNALTLEPKEVMALLTRANINLLRGKTRDAVNDSRKALKLNPGQSWAYVTYGSALTMDGRKDEGLKMLNQALAMAPEDGEACLARGRCLAALGRTGDAKKDFEKAAAVDASLKEAASEELKKLQAK